ncbi:DUF7144 family membrane protein [Pseudonocardia broussonetiae]|uniref:DUF7144 family membrane protein n=1 Tax=Pseudonocardia broussonetiae TaxID=2736640 RepID=UPI0019630B1D|nr:hypothetical protein [Pseudonocardia broussonetiae]
MSTPEAHPDQSYRSYSVDDQPAGWVVGLSLLAGVLMIMAGVFNVVQGLVALFENEVYLTTPRYVFAFDLTTWGWIHLLIGLAVAVAGFGVLAGRIWGRIVGIAITALCMIGNFLFVPYYPVWSLLLVALNVFTIWALCAYDRSAPENT